ncbi:MAG: hypothetical protein F4X35_05150 [Alphaproteobacteria bacterium]|nr:hypothetical protein [Alphaproteobacteria bacterium]
MSAAARIVAGVFVMAIVLFLGGIAWGGQAAPLPSTDERQGGLSLTAAWIVSDNRRAPGPGQLGQRTGAGGGCGMTPPPRGPMLRA